MPVPSPVVWRTRDGRTLRLRDMTSQHLYHTINMIGRWIAGYNSREQSYPARYDTMWRAMAEELHSRR